MKKCFLCGRNGSEDRLERHHIFGGPFRSKSEEFGLTVYLCGERCHRSGNNAVHRNLNVAEYLHKYGQKKAMKEQNLTVEQFIQMFGKNYL